MQADGGADGDGLAGHTGLLVRVGRRVRRRRLRTALRSLPCSPSGTSGRSRSAQATSNTGDQGHQVATGCGPPRRARRSRRAVRAALTSSAIERPPVTALPSMIEGITRSGSAAANGIAPSVMNEAPSSQAALPFSRSRRREQLRPEHGGQGQGQRRHHAGQHHRGHHLQLRGVAGGRGDRAADAGGREAVGDLVQRATHVEGHHQAEDDTEEDRLGAAAQAVQAVGEARSSAAPSGLPSTMIMIDAGDHRGEQRDHHAPASGRAAQVGTLRRTRSSARSHRRAHRRRCAPRKPVCGVPKADVGGQAAHHEAGRDAGAVGDRVGDVAGQRRDEEGERASPMTKKTAPM